MTTASNQTYSDPYLTNLRDSRKKSIGVEFMVNPEHTYTMRKMAALKGFTEAQTQPRISELLTDGVIKVVSQRTDQIMKSKVSVYQFVKCEDRAAHVAQITQLDALKKSLKKLSSPTLYDMYIDEARRIYERNNLSL